MGYVRSVVVAMFPGPKEIAAGDRRGTETLTRDVQNQLATETKTEELTAEQLENVAAGLNGNLPIQSLTGVASSGFYGTGVYKTTDGGRG